MKQRNMVRIAAIALAAGISLGELAAIALLANYRPARDEAVALLPRVLVTPADVRVEPSGEAPRSTIARAAPGVPR